MSIAFSPDGLHVASAASLDNKVSIWNAATGKQLLELKGHTNRVTSVAFSTNNQLLASGSLDKTVCIWNTTMWNMIVELKGHTGHVTGVAFSSDGRYVASCSADETVRIWDAATWKELMKIDDHNGPVSCVAFSPDSQHVASCSWDNAVGIRLIYDEIYTDDNRKLPANWERVTDIDHSRSATTVAFSPDGKYVASGAYMIGESSFISDAVTGEKLLEIKETQLVNTIVFSPDGKRIAVSCNNLVFILDVATGKQLQFINAGARVGNVIFSHVGVAFSPDGFDVAFSVLDSVMIEKDTTFCQAVKTKAIDVLMESNVLKDLAGIVGRYIL